MIYRIDDTHFLTHAIDYFTRDELLHFQYAIFSASIQNGGRTTNVVKINELYPLVDITIEYQTNHDEKIAKNEYREFIHPSTKENVIGQTQYNLDIYFYNYFINPLLNHHDIMIVCAESENMYVDVLCEVLEKYYDITVIDLNILFTEGKIGPISIDMDDIHDIAVDIRKKALNENIKQLECTAEGRLKSLSVMSTKNKKKKLDSLGILYNKGDNLDQLLIDSWVKDE